MLISYDKINFEGGTQAGSKILPAHPKHSWKISKQDLEKVVFFALLQLSEPYLPKYFLLWEGGAWKVIPHLWVL